MAQSAINWIVNLWGQNPHWKTTGSVIASAPYRADFCVWYEAEFLFGRFFPSSKKHQKNKMSRSFFLKFGSKLVLYFPYFVFLNSLWYVRPSSVTNNGNLRFGEKDFLVSLKVIFKIRRFKYFNQPLMHRIFL